MIQGHSQVKPCQPANLAALASLAKQDNHSVYFPTHVICKNEQMTGYFSVGSRPTVLAWLSTRHMMARDSFSLINLVENQLALSGSKGVIFPVQTFSPFHPVMPSLGFSNMGRYDLFLKEFDNFGIS